MTHTYTITGVTCSSCVEKVTRLLTAIPSVTGVSFAANNTEISVEMQKHVSTSSLNEALKNTKYSIAETAHTNHTNMAAEETKEASFKPIYMIFGYIIAATLLVQWQQGSFNWMQWMQHFMGGFFLVFSFFKLLDVKGFAMSYSSYDIVAKKFFGYGYVYPFIELALGLWFISGYELRAANVVTLVVMSVSTIGVVQSLMRKSKFKCACLGAVFNLPMSYITLTEDSLMVLMSAAMLAF